MATLDDLLGTINQRQAGVDDPNVVSPVDVNLQQANPNSASMPSLQTAGDQMLMSGPSQQNVQMQDNPTFNPSQSVGQGQQPTGINYNNSQQVQDLNSAIQGEGTPRGGSANPGVYGLLPANLQHGTLRNVLGAIGDAFLVGGGGTATYGPRMERQSIGNAMAGYDPNDPNSIQAAIQRVAATGAPGSTEMADQLQKNANDIAMRKQVMEQNNWYRQSQIQARQDQAFNRIYSTVTGDLGRATNEQEYQAALARADQRVKTIDPTTDAVTALGVPEHYDPNQVNGQMGTTSNQANVSAIKQRGQDMTQQNVNARNQTTIQAARIGAGSRIESSNTAANKPTDATIMSGLIQKQNNNQPLTAAEQRFFDYHTTHGGKTSRSLPANVQVGGQHAAAAPNQGPGATDVAYLKAHPNLRAQFDAHFGNGASAKILGH